MSEENIESKEQEVSGYDVQEWLNHPYTEKLYTILERLCDMYKEQWARGGMLGDAFETTAQANVYASGKTSAYGEVLVSMKRIDQEQVPEDPRKDISE